MSEDTEDSPRPWALNRWCIRVSLLLAVLVWLGFIATPLLALMSGKKNILLWIPPAVWPFFYVILYLTAWGMAKVDQWGPITGYFPAFLRAFSPSWMWSLLDSFYRIFPNVALLVFPGFVSPWAALLVWAAISGKLNP